MDICYKLLSSSDCDLQTFAPAPGSAWCMQVDISFGDAHCRDEERFQFVLVSLAYVHEELEKNGLCATGRLVIVKDYDFERLNAYLRKVAEDIAASSKDWTSFAKALNWYFQWEFENMTT